LLSQINLILSQINASQGNLFFVFLNFLWSKTRPVLNQKRLPYSQLCTGSMLSPPLTTHYIIFLWRCSKIHGSCRQRPYVGMIRSTRVIQEPFVYLKNVAPQQECAYIKIGRSMPSSLTRVFYFKISLLVCIVIPTALYCTLLFSDGIYKYCWFYVNPSTISQVTYNTLVGSC
jgi:hypothetical protein